MAYKKFDFSLFGNIKIEFTLTEDLSPQEQHELIHATYSAFKWIDDNDDEPSIKEIKREIHNPVLLQKVRSCSYYITTVFYRNQNQT